MFSLFLLIESCCKKRLVTTAKRFLQIYKSSCYIPNSKHVDLFLLIASCFKKRLAASNYS